MQKIIGAIVAVIVAAAIPQFHKSLSMYMMGFFRDLSRVKARKRRMQKDAVISMNDIRAIVFNEEEDPLQDVVDKIMDESYGFGHRNGLTLLSNEDDSIVEDLPIYTREELYEFGNGEGDDDEENGILLLSVFGRVYDVSKGDKYYGPDGKYHLFAGRDVTRSLATGCLQTSCLGSKESRSDKYIDTDTNMDEDAFELTEKAIKEAKKWVAFFETHDVYKHVGFLKDGQSIEHMIDSLVEQETASLYVKSKSEDFVLGSGEE